MKHRAAVAALLVALAGCGGSSSSEDEPTPSPTATAAATVTTGTAFGSGSATASSSTRLTAGRESVVRRPLRVEGAPVRVRSVDVPLPDSVRVRPVRRAPGDGETQSFSDRGGWPPPGTDGVLAGTSVAGTDTDAVVGFTPTRPGVIVLGGLAVTYDRDGQRFRQVTPDFDCFVVGPGPSACDVAGDFPGDRVVGLGVSFPPD